MASKQIPLFVKGGTLLPLAEPVEFIKPDTCFDITVNIVGDKPADFTLYEDDGVTTAYAKGEQSQSSSTRKETIIPPNAAAITTGLPATRLLPGNNFDCWQELSRC